MQHSIAIGNFHLQEVEDGDFGEVKYVLTYKPDEETTLTSRSFYAPTKNFLLDAASALFGKYEKEEEIDISYILDTAPKGQKQKLAFERAEKTYKFFSDVADLSTYELRYVNDKLTAVKEKAVESQTAEKTFYERVYGN